MTPRPPQDGGGDSGNATVSPEADVAASSESSDSLPPRRLWAWAGVLWLMLMGVAVLANPGTVEFIHRHWQSDAYGHSWIVVLIAAWLVWRLRKPMLALQPAPNVWGLVLLAGIAMVWWLGYALEIRTVQQLAFTAAVTGITWALLGTRVTWLLAFPLLYLFLTVSAWDVMIHPLQDATAWLSAYAVQALGVPLYREGHYLWIPAGQFLVDEECAGLRYFLAGMSIGTLYAYLSFDDLWRRSLFIGLTMLWALVMNVVRVSMVVYAGHLTNMQHAWIQDHGDMGWVLFGVALLLLFLAGALVQRLRPALHLRPVGTLGVSPGRGLHALALGSVAAAALVAAAPAGAQWLEARALAAGAQASPPQLPRVDGWEGPLLPPANWTPRFPAADAQDQAAYRSTAGSVYLYLGWYAYERGDAKLLYYRNQLFERRQWRLQSETRRSVALGGSEFAVREQVLRDPVGGAIRVLWSWYTVGGQATTSGLRAKLLGLRGILAGDPQAAVTALAADSGTDAAAARGLLRDYLQAARDLRP